MSAEQFLDRAEALVREIRETQLDAIKQAGVAIADSLAAGGVLHYYDRGHCTGEILHRAGGLFAIHPLQFGIQAGAETPPSRNASDRPDWAENDEVLDFLLDHAMVREGDIALVCSVSGGSPSAVGVALALRRRGTQVIAITSPTYSKAITSHHSSGKFLYEVADIVIDNCGPVGDAMLTMPGFEIPVVPSSGLAFVTIAWSVLAHAMRTLTERGIAPTVYKSVNLPDGVAYNAEARKVFEEKGL